MEGFQNKVTIKQEFGRLASLNNYKDLSLGGTKPKKIYTPNLNVVRNKTKAAVHVAESLSHGKKSTVRTRSNNFNKDANKGRYIQQTGVFTEGTAQIKRPTLYSDKHSNARESDTNSGIIKPKVGRNWEVDHKAEATVVQDLLNYDDSESDNDGEYDPIVLPLTTNQGGFVGSFKVKMENVKIKKEDIKEYSDDSNNSVISGITPSSFITNKIYDDENPSISLVKFPDSLPGKGFDENDVATDYTVRQMNEGQIGKILVRRSGKLEVVIGDTRYLMDAVEASQFREELMHTSENLTDNATLTNFGAVSEKFVLAPNWNNLLVKNDK